MNGNKTDWYKDAIIYELHIKAFRDSNGDGIGDLVGLMEKLDHLVDLGITAIWLLPFFPSPLKDDGYDIADYYSIHPDYGNIYEFRKLLQEAHKRNLKVIIELVINHTSDQHPWFKRAVRATKDSPERNYYVWSDDPSKYKDVRIIFQDYEKSNWSWSEEAGQYYWHRFFQHQPDLNYDNPTVQNEIFAIMDHWCKMGVDGFRLDAIPYLFERDGTNGENLPETHSFLKKLRSYVDDHYPGILLLAEANMWPRDAAAYFGDGDECHMNFHFPLMPRMFMAIEMEDKYPVIDIFDQTPSIPFSCQWAIFLRNHDELTLEMVTDDERDYMYRSYAKDPKARINLGIRHRLAPLLSNDRRKIELMNALLFSLPGTPVIYYGDEIGMGDNFYLGDRNGVRTPMQWSPDRNAGFSPANPQLLYLPVILDPAYHHEALNIETQKQNTSSLLWFMKRMIAARKKYEVFGRGDLHFVYTDNTKILAFTRTYGNETFLAINNLSKFPQYTSLELKEHAGKIPYELFSSNPFMPIANDAPYRISIGPHGFYWFLLKPQKDIQLAKSEITWLTVNHWKDILKAPVKEILESTVIPGYLKKAKWFTKKRNAIINCTIKDHLAVDTGPYECLFLFIEISYRSGFPDMVQVPVFFSDATETSGETTLAELTIDGKHGMLADCFYDPRFALWLLNSMQPTAGSPSSMQSLKFDTYSLANEISRWNRSEPVETKDDPGQETTVIYYGKDLLMKIFRLIDPGMHPSPEISAYLYYNAGFPATLPPVGIIKWNTGKESYTLGVLEQNAPDTISAQEYLTERVNNYIERILALENPRQFLQDIPAQFSFAPSFDDIDPALATLLGNRSASVFNMIGERLAECHLALGRGKEDSFIPEPFTLHYQQSLYSSIRGIARRLLNTISRRKDQTTSNDYEFLLPLKDEINSFLQQITEHKLAARKIRIHGNLDLLHLLVSGKDVYIRDFGGDSLKHLSRRRLKRSPLVDVASLIISIFRVANQAFADNALLHGDRSGSTKDLARLWAVYMSGFFLGSYLESMNETDLVPPAKDQIETMLEIYILEQSFTILHDCLNSGKDDIPGIAQLLKMILSGN